LTNKKEIEILIGMFFRMGIVKMPRARSYWEHEARYSLVTDAMPGSKHNEVYKW
jgi:hypothetical protein